MCKIDGYWDSSRQSATVPADVNPTSLALKILRVRDLLVKGKGLAGAPETPTGALWEGLVRNAAALVQGYATGTLAALVSKNDMDMAFCVLKVRDIMENQTQKVLTPQLWEELTHIVGLTVAQWALPEAQVVRNAAPVPPRTQGYVAPAPTAENPMGLPPDVELGTCNSNEKPHVRRGWCRNWTSVKVKS